MWDASAFTQGERITLEPAKHSWVVRVQENYPVILSDGAKGGNIPFHLQKRTGNSSPRLKQGLWLGDSKYLIDSKNQTKGE